MDGELFTTEPHGGVGPKWFKSADTVEKMTQQHAWYSTYRTGHAFKMLCYVGFVLLLIRVVVEFTQAIPVIGNAWKTFVAPNAPPAKKEGLQWLGASSDVIRGDYENKTDSLAEKAAKQASRETDMSAQAVKAAFYSRENLTTPEEELMKTQRS